MRNMELSRLYAARFGPEDQARKNRIWQVLCRHFFQEHVDSGDTALDITAGYCESITHIGSRRRTAWDLSEEVRAHTGPGVEVVQGISTALSSLPNELIDGAFASNFFEYFLTKQDVLWTLAAVRRVLRPGGRLLILQPDIRYAGGAYSDFFDHHLPLTERCVEALEFAGLKPTEVRPRFLPFTSNSVLPQYPFLVWLYLKLTIAQRILGQQSRIVAVKL
jgi:ubiquinone/menaquinone biosynthesis C-methylase UbiE